jgi:hypothetical protein
MKQDQHEPGKFFPEISIFFPKERKRPQCDGYQQIDCQRTRKIDEGRKMFLMQETRASFSRLPRNRNH